MNKILETIARENFLTSGYITHPRRERRKPWTFTSLPKSTYRSINSVSKALERRERAYLRSQAKPSLIRHWIHVLLHHEVDIFSTNSGHIPVLLNETLELFAPRGGMKFLDGTFGGGGHTRAILDCDENVKVVALDRDPSAIERAEKLVAEVGERFCHYHINFGEIENLDESEFDGVLFDFGLSSFQLDSEERGFSFRHDAPVDMRMNPKEGISAAEFLETADEEALVRAVRNYGEEKRWRRVVKAIIASRGTGQLQRTHSLAELIVEAVGPTPKGRKAIHPATKNFSGGY